MCNFDPITPCVPKMGKHTRKILHYALLQDFELMFDYFAKTKHCKLNKNSLRHKWFPVNMKAFFRTAQSRDLEVFRGALRNSFTLNFGRFSIKYTWLKHYLYIIHYITLIKVWGLQTPKLLKEDSTIDVFLGICWNFLGQLFKRILPNICFHILERSLLELSLKSIVG